MSSRTNLSLKLFLKCIVLDSFSSNEVAAVKQVSGESGPGGIIVSACQNVVLYSGGKQSACFLTYAAGQFQEHNRHSPLLDKGSNFCL